jgi:hypothetical protein
MGFGARKIPRNKFMKMLKNALTAPTKKGRWKLKIKQDFPDVHKAFD